jgi:hypothetical protein
MPDLTSRFCNQRKEKAMATLELKTLRCIRKQDITGKDEPRIKVDGVPVWNGAVTKNGSIDIGITISFEEQANVIAEEMNNTKPKQIGAAVVVRESGNPKFMTFKTSGTWYEVDFEVTEAASTSTTAKTRR